MAGKICHQDRAQGPHLCFLHGFTTHVILNHDSMGHHDHSHSAARTETISGSSTCTTMSNLAALMKASCIEKFRAFLFSALFAASLFLAFPCTTVAQTVGHNNQLDISLVEGRLFQCDFSLNLLPLLHSHLAPKSHPGEFLQSFSKLSDGAMDKELDKLTQALSTQSFFTLPTGDKLRFKQWQLPSKQLIREAMKISLLLMQMPPNAASHIDPMLVQAKASSKVPMSRVQLQLHPSLFPIFVANKEDKFWLTPEIPSAIMEIQ